MRILLATGGSAHSEAALRFGAQIAVQAGEPPTILTVVRHQDEGPQAEAILAQARSIVAAWLPFTQAVWRVGQPGHQIVQEATEGHYELIVVGERERHRLRTRLLLGSTARYVVEHAPCPVIIAKGAVRPVRRILLCDNSLDKPSVLGRFAVQLAQMLHGEEEIVVLHVMSQIPAWPGVPGRQLRASAEELMAEHTPEGEMLAQDIALLALPGVHPRAKVRHGPVVEEILAEAESGDYDLLILEARRNHGWQRYLLEDIAHDVITRVHRPVLVVR